MLVIHSWHFLISKARNNQKYQTLNGCNYVAARIKMPRVAVERIRSNSRLKILPEKYVNGDMKKIRMNPAVNKRKIKTKNQLILTSVNPGDNR